MTRAANSTNAGRAGRRHQSVSAASAVLGAMLTLGLGSLLVGGAGTGCTENPYKADTWIKKLSDRNEQARAVTELERLGDPKAIPALAKAWEDSGRDPKILDVIISMAKPFTKAEVMSTGPDGKTFCTIKNDPRCFMLRDFPDGRAASWDKAMPVLTKVLSDVDDLDSRWLESASKAATAIGESGDAEGITVLVQLINRNMNPKANRVKFDAIIALGKFKDPRALDALTNVLRTDQSEGEIATYGALFGAAINALADLRSGDAVPVLVETMYLYPPLFVLVRRALAASGATVGPKMRGILRGDDATFEAWFKEKKLNVYCGDAKKPQRPLAECDATSAHDYYAATILGDLYDSAGVPELVAALKRPPLPVYYNDDTPAQLIQQVAIFGALQKIGSAEAAPAVQEMWASATQPTTIRTMALQTYPLVARDNSAVDALVKIAEGQDEQAVRESASTAFAGIATSDSQLGLLSRMAEKYAALSAEQAALAAKEQPAYDKAKQEQVDAKKVYGDLNSASKLLSAKALKDKSVTTEDLKKAADAVIASKEKLEVANTAFKAATAKWKPLDDMTKGYRAAQRFFQTQAARVEIAIRCKADASCYISAIPMNADGSEADFEKASLDKKSDEIAGHLATYISDLKDWSVEEKRGLVFAQIDRAMVELGKLGSKAADVTPTLLKAVQTENSSARSSILLALPKVAAIPCADCEAALDKAITAAEGKSTLKQITDDTQMVRNYFSWAGK